MSPLSAPGGEERDLSPAPFGFTAFARQRARVQHRPCSQMLAARAPATWVCRFPRVSPPDITTASPFVLFNRAPTLKRPSNYCSQSLGVQEPTLITEFPAHEADAGCAAPSWRRCFKPAGSQDQALSSGKRNRDSRSRWRTNSPEREEQVW